MATLNIFQPFVEGLGLTGKTANLVFYGWTNKPKDDTIWTDKDKDNTA